MSKSVKRGCIALLTGTALSVTMGVQGAKADQLDNILYECDRAQASGRLTPEFASKCNYYYTVKQQNDRLIKVEKDRVNQQTSDAINESTETTIRKSWDIMTNPRVPEPTKFIPGY